MLKRSDNLPGILGVIADIAGVKKAIRISQHLAGHRFWIGTRITKKHCLVDYLSAEELEKLCIVYEGRQVEVPTCGVRKRYHIVEMLQAGVSAGEIARQLKVTRRWVRQIRKQTSS